MKKSRLMGTVCAFIFTAFSSASTMASMLYGANGSFYSIDPSTGTSTLINTGNNDYRLGLAYNSLTDTMYSLGFFTGNLSTIDLGTGATTLIGTSSTSATGLTFSSDFSTLYSLNGNDSDLIAIDPSDGSAVTIGATTGGINLELDLSTDSAGTVYAGGFGGISTVNTSTGATTLIGGSLDWTAIAFDENDILYGVEINTDALYIIDTTDGSATLVGGDIGSDIRGMAFATVPIPAAVWLFGSGLIGLIGIARRKKAT